MLKSKNSNNNNQKKVIIREQNKTMIKINFNSRDGKRHNKIKRREKNLNFDD